MLMTRGGYGSGSANCGHGMLRCSSCERGSWGSGSNSSIGSAGALWGHTSYVDGQTYAQRLGFTTDQSALVNAFAEGAGFGLVSGFASSFMAMRSINPYTALAGGFIGYLREYSSQFTEWENSIKGN